MDASVIDDGAGGAATEPSIWPMVRHVFLRWELLRIPYNLVLTVESVALMLVTEAWMKFAPPVSIVAQIMFAAIGANVAYLLGPTVESYLAWLGFRNGLIRYVLFMLGTAFSMLVVLSVFAMLEFAWEMQQYYGVPQPTPAPAPPIGPI